MIAILTALIGAISYGVADFMGGIASRRSQVLNVVTVSAPASLVAGCLCAVGVGATWSEQAVIWGAVSGIASAAAFCLLYMTLAIGPMTVLSPVAAVVTAILPVAVGLFSGESFTRTSWCAVGLAALAVILVARGAESQSVTPTARGLWLAVASGIAIALQLIALHQAPAESGLAPIIMGRFVASVIVIIPALVTWQRFRRQPFAWLPAIAAGVLDELANMFFVFGSHSGLLSVTTVIVSLYPAATVLLAWIVLREQVARIQQVGLLMAGVAIGLLAVG